MTLCLPSRTLTLINFPKGWSSVTYVLVSDLYKARRELKSLNSLVRQVKKFKKNKHSICMIKQMTCVLVGISDSYFPYINVKS